MPPQVYDGAPNIADFAPDAHSYINVRSANALCAAAAAALYDRLDGHIAGWCLHGWLAAWQLRDFDSVEAVMAHMQFLDGNASAYDEYLAWKVRHLPLAERCVSSLRVASTPLSHADSSDCY